MPQPDIPAVGQGADLQGVIDYLILLRRRLNDFMAHLDTLNIDELDAKVVIANTVTADKMNVTQLSAIAADLGTITAGIIIGTLIKTATDGARIEINGNMLTTYAADGKARGIAWGDIFGPNFGDVGFFDEGIQTMLFTCLGSASGWQITPDSGAPLYLGGTGKQIYGLGDWQMNGTFKLGASSQFGSVTQTDSTATTVAQLVTDFNALLANLRSLGILA